MRRILVMAMALSVCGGLTSWAAAQNPTDGVWQGTYTSTHSPNPTPEILIFKAVGSEVVGAYLSASQSAGTLIGHQSGNNYAFQVTQPVDGCPPASGTLQATISGGVLSYSFSARSCHGTDSGGPLLGVSPHQSTIENGNRRVTSFQKYITPFLNTRPNLTVVGNALVNRIVFSGSRATGVNLTVGGNNEILAANREVILSAGAINNPQLLMLSGIGAADALKEQGIEQVVESPLVGQNLQDAIIFKGVWSTRQAITDQPANLGYAIVWADPEDAQQPQTCLEMTRGTYICDESEPELQRNYVVTGGAMRQRSQGSVRLASFNPGDAPIIDLNLLSASGDYEQCRLAFDRMRQVGNSAGLSAWRFEERVPGPNVVTGDQIRQWILNNAFSYSHPVGTCAMAGGTAGVVDPRLRVNGVTGLRVVDVSIMPRITSGHTQGPAFMIGDKGADMILQDA